MHSGEEVGECEMHKKKQEVYFLMKTREYSEKIRVLDRSRTYRRKRRFLVKFGFSGTERVETRLNVVKFAMI